MADEGSEHIPAVHIIHEGERWGICLSRLAKWIATITALVTASFVTGAFAFAWQSNARLAKLDELPRQLEQINTSLRTMVLEDQMRGIRNSEDISEIKGRIGMLQKGGK